MGNKFFRGLIFGLKLVTPFWIAVAIIIWLVLR